MTGLAVMVDGASFWSYNLLLQNLVTYHILPIPKSNKKVFQTTLYSVRSHVIPVYETIGADLDADNVSSNEARPHYASSY